MYILRTFVTHLLVHIHQKKKIALEIAAKIAGLEDPEIIFIPFPSPNSRVFSNGHAASRITKLKLQYHSLNRGQNTKYWHASCSHVLTAQTKTVEKNWHWTLNFCHYSWFPFLVTGSDLTLIQSNYNH